MSIDKQNILSLPVSRAIVFHSVVLDYLHRNIEEVFDYGLMDDIILHEYEVGVDRVSNPEMTDAERIAVIDSLATILSTALQNAQDHITARTPYPIFADFVKFIKDNYYLLHYPANNSCS